MTASKEALLRGLETAAERVREPLRAYEAV